MLGTGVARASATFVVSESQARAGDAVHFSIAGTDEDTTYVVEVADRTVASGTDRPGKGVSGQFTMPDLGPAAKTVTVEGQVRADGEQQTFKRTLQFLGPAASPPAAPTPVPATPTPAAAAAPRAKGADGPSSRGQLQETPARKRHRRRPHRRAHARRSPGATHTPVAGPRPAVTRHHDRSGGAKVKTRRVVLDAPLFKGVAEHRAKGSGGAAATGPGFLGLNAIAPPHAVLASTPGPAGSGPPAALFVAVMLGMTALLLAGTVLARRRRIAAAGQARKARLSAFSRVAGRGSDLQRGIKRRRDRDGPGDD